MVKGSHKWPGYLKPERFDGVPFEVKPRHEKESQQFLPTPDVDRNKDYEVLSWNMEVSNGIQKRRE